MRKFITIILVLVMSCLMLAGCGNMALLDPGNFTFEHIHSDTYHDPMCFNVEKWWDNENGIEVKTKECGTLYFSEGDYVLVEKESACPYCQGGDIAAATPQH